MGFYLNPGNKGGGESIRSQIYVDKTNLIACTNRLINTEEKFVCVSRPRRFGKSMTLKMLAAYYSCISGTGCDRGASEKLLEDTLAGDETKVAEGLDKAHGEVASVLTYNDENSRSLPNELLGKDLLAAIGLAYYSA